LIPSPAKSLWLFSSSFDFFLLFIVASPPVVIRWSSLIHGLPDHVPDISCLQFQPLQPEPLPRVLGILFHFIILTFIRF
jgi:hypothetical protein